MRHTMGKAMLALVLLVIVCVTSSEGGRREGWGWFWCGCKWAGWESWSDCTASCYGYQHRSRKMYRAAHCDGVTDCYTYSGSALDSEWHEWRDCNAYCPYGVRYGSGRSKYCGCPSGRYGICCTNRISCGSPSSVSNGHYSYSGTYYGDTVSYSCHSDYRMVGGSSRTCERWSSGSNTGAWSGYTPSCRFARTCRSNPCQHGSCEDLIEQYTCHCYSGWAGFNCERDIQPPVVYSCPSSISRLTSQHTVNVTWTKPIIRDPHGFEVRMSSNYDLERFEFPWGDFAVHYYAYKPNNGMRATCTFNIRIRPYPCPSLPAPKRGMMVCNGWQKDMGRFCLATCLQDFYLPLGYDPSAWLVCGASGSWSSNLVATECLDHHHTKPVSLLPQPRSCQDTAVLDEVRVQFIQHFNASHFGKVFCQDMGTQCRPGKVDIVCQDG